MIAVLRGARREGARRDLQRPSLELPDPRAGDDRRRLGAADRPPGRARGGAGAEADARLRVLEREALDDARASVPRRSVLEAVTELLEQLEGTDPAELTDPRHYNIRWLELLCEVRPALDSFRRFCEGADHRRRRPARLATSQALLGRELDVRASATPSSTSPTTRRVERAFERGRARRRLQLRRVPQRRRLRERARAGVGGQRRGGAEPGRGAARRSSTSRPTTSSTARRERAVRRGRSARRRGRSTRSPSSPASTRRWPTASAAGGAHRRPLRPPRQRRPRAATSSQRMIARAREQGALADGRRPAPAADLHRRSGGGAGRGGRGAAPTGVVHLTSGGDVLLARVHRGDHGAGRDRRADRAGRDDGPARAAPTAR